MLRSCALGRKRENYVIQRERERERDREEKERGSYVLESMCMCVIGREREC